MANKKKSKDLNHAADRTYDYLLSHRKQILRYLAAAVATGLLQLLLEWVLFSAGIGTLIPFFLRAALLFAAAKFWVYEEKGTGAFYTARQIMLTFMLILIASALVNALSLALMKRVAHPMLIRYSFQGLLELLSFLIYHFIIFKKPKNG